MKCEHCQEWLNQYIDYELSDEESAWVKEHISACKSCRQDYNKLVYTKQASLSIPDYAPPRSFTEAWKAEVLADMAPAASQVAAPKKTAAARQAAPPRRKAAQPRLSGMQRAVRGFALAAAAVVLCVISIQAYNHFTAMDTDDNVALHPAATEQATDEMQRMAGGNSEPRASVEFAAPAESGFVDSGSEDTTISEEPEDTGYDDTTENAESRTDESALMPQSTNDLETPGDLAAAELDNESSGAQHAVNGMKEVFLSGVDREAIEAEFQKYDIDFKYFEEAYIVIADADNTKDINKALAHFGSTEVMEEGETLHLKLR